MVNPAPLQRRDASQSTRPGVSERRDASRRTFIVRRDAEQTGRLRRPFAPRPGKEAEAAAPFPRTRRAQTIQGGMLVTGRVSVR